MLTMENNAVLARTLRVDDLETLGTSNQTLAEEAIRAGRVGEATAFGDLFPQTMPHTHTIIDNWRTEINGVSTDYQVIRDWPLASGTFFTQDDQRALRKVLQRMPDDPPMPRVKTYTITVADQLENVRSYLRTALVASAGEHSRRGVSFETLLGRGATRIEVIVTFLAVLELVKLREIEVVQDDTFGEIQLVPVSAGDALAEDYPTA